jgi:hypothetical protein
VAENKKAPANQGSQPARSQPEPADAGNPQSRHDRRTRSGPGQVLVWVYGIFALAATARAAVQISTKFGVAPLAYVLSAVSGVIYILATIGLARATPGSRRLAWAAIAAELAGVLGVGTFSVVDPAAFPDQSVWSDYGGGYIFIPLVLPFFGLGWLWRTRRRRN